MYEISSNWILIYSNSIRLSYIHSRTLFAFIYHSFLEDNERRILDVGCGPSISNIISASKWSQNIIMADFLDSNRREVERFWKVCYHLVLPLFFIT